MDDSVSTSNRPFFVDLDGTLVQTDLLDEQISVLARRHPIKLLTVFLHLFRGKAAFKERLTKLTIDQIDVETLPYDQTVIDETIRRRQEGSSTELISGSHNLVVQKIAAHLGIFDDSIGTELGRNLTGTTKASLISEKQPSGFAYVGNAKADIPVWKLADEALLAQATDNPTNLTKQVPELKVLSTQASGFGTALVSGMRIHQWAKNGLVFLPLLLTLSQDTTLSQFASCFLGFIAFCALSSGTYFINDFVDVRADRRHPTKKFRALASGVVSLRTGLAFGTLLMIIGYLLGWYISLGFLTVLAVYTVLTMAYSLYLKRVLALDVLTITLLFLLRAQAGAVIIGQEMTVWLSAFLLFFFLALAISKRVIELRGTDSDLQDDGSNGRPYLNADTIALTAAGISLSVASVMLFLIYAILEQQSLYQDHWAIILTVGLLAFWLLRFWILICRNEVDMDPVTFVLRDPATFATLAIVMIIALAEQLPRLLA